MVNHMERVRMQDTPDGVDLVTADARGGALRVRSAPSVAMQPPYGPPNPSSPYAPTPYARPPAPPPGGSRPVLALLGIGAIAALCGLAAILRAREVDEFGPLSVACAGTPVPVARAFVPGQPHRLVGMRMSGGGWTLDASRVPGSVRATELHNTDMRGGVLRRRGDADPRDVHVRRELSRADERGGTTRAPSRSCRCASSRRARGRPSRRACSRALSCPACDSQGGSGASANAFHVQGPSVGAADVLAWLELPRRSSPERRRTLASPCTAGPPERASRRT